MSPSIERALQQQVIDLQRENAELKALVRQAQENPRPTAHPPEIGAAAQPVGIEKQLPDLATGAKRSYQGLRALVVDDHRVNQLLAKHLLQLLGFEVDVAGDGEQAVRAVQTSQFDVVLMDLQMPILDGWQATHLIRQWEQSQGKPRIPVIALTAHPESNGREHNLSIGIDGYVQKPLTLQALQTALEASHLRVPVDDSSPVNRPRLLARLGQDEAALKQMAKAFCLDLRKCLNQILQGMQSQDWVLVSAQAHGLKGLLASMTAETAAAEARALELAAQAGDAAGAKAAFSRLTESAKLAVDAVQRW